MDFHEGGDEIILDRATNAPGCEKRDVLGHFTHQKMIKTNFAELVDEDGSISKGWIAENMAE